MISVDNKNLKSKFSPRTSSVKIIDPISETENKVGFRGVDKDKDSYLYRQKEVSFLAEPSEDFIKDESVQLSKIVSFKDEPNKDIEKQNTKAQGYKVKVMGQFLRRCV